MTLNITSNYSHCIYVPGSRSIISFVTPAGVTHHGGKSLEQVRRSRPELAKAELMAWSDVRALIEAVCITPPEHVTREHFEQMRDLMPPATWTRDGNTESFQLMEHTSLNVTRTLVRLGSTHWQFEDIAGRPHAELVQKVIDFTHQQLADAIVADGSHAAAQEA